MLRKHIPFLYALALALTVTVCVPSISAAGYLYRRTVTIDHTKVPNTDQSNFPVLFSGTYSYLATVANGGRVTNSSGFDIIFTSDSAGATTLDHEIESYNATTGAVNFWVRVPTVSHTTDTVIYLWYGNSAISSSQENKTGVWDSNFKGVWHLKEDPAGTAPQIKDSTSNANNGTSHGSMTSGDQVTGQIDGSLDIDGVDDFINIPSVSSIDNIFAGGGTVALWVNPTSFAADAAIAKANWLVRNSRFQHNFTGGTEGKGEWNMSPAMTIGSWQHIAIVYNKDSSSNTPIYYKNGVQGTMTAVGGGIPGGTALTDVGSNLKIGQWISQVWLGLIDEVRVSNTVRSADWVKAEYNNQNSPSTFYTLGAEVNFGVTDPRRSHRG